MMSAQTTVDHLNEALREKYPDAYTDKHDWEFKIIGINRTELIRFNDTWITQYIEQGILNYEEEEEED